MDTQTKQITLSNIGGTVVLTATATIPKGISERADRFYCDIAAAFERWVRETIYEEAVAAYEASSDRRKRYRFVPLKAVLCSKPIPKGVELYALWQGEYFFRERHFWENDLLRKREKIV